MEREKKQWTMAGTLWAGTGIFSKRGSQIDCETLKIGAKERTGPSQ